MRKKGPYFAIPAAILLSMSVTACAGGNSGRQAAATAEETTIQETATEQETAAKQGMEALQETADEQETAGAAETENGESVENDTPGDTGAVASSEELHFILGQKIESDSFTGNAYIEMMIANDETYNFPQTNHLTFEPGARSSWHTHGGMVLLITGGVGYYQEEGKPAQILRPGDVVNIEPG